MRSPTTTDDAALVARALARDAAGRDAFDALVRRHHPMLARAVLRVLDGDASAAADATQDAVLQALVGLRGLREPSAFGAWLTGIGLRVARRLASRRRSEDGERDHLDALAAPAHADPAEQAQRAAVVARVRAAVAALPAGQRDAVFLHYLAGLSQAEVAEQLGTAEGAVRTRLHKARATLREHLEPERNTYKMPETAQHVPMRIADVRPTGEDGYSATHVVLLEESGGDRALAIWIDTFEAHALVAALESVDLPRPGTYAFAAALLGAAGARATAVRVARLEGGVFYAVVELEGGASLDARPSDALNLALLTGAQVTVDAGVLAAATERPEGEEPGAPALAAALRERIATRPGPP